METWFGSRFSELDPALQALHRHGGVLRGLATIKVGNGVAGIVGGRLAKKLGVHTGQNLLTVTIRNAEDGLHWSRKFNESKEIHSLFKPHGTINSGYWTETTGMLTLKLNVSTESSGWHWHQISTCIFGLRIPKWLCPKVSAYKQIVAGEYLFFVAIAFPMIGEVLQYTGRLNSASLAP